MGMEKWQNNDTTALRETYTMLHIKVVFETDNFTKGHHMVIKFATHDKAARQSVKFW